MIHHKPASFLLILGAFILGLSGCYMGPKVLTCSTTAYNISASQSINEQMLVNLVRMRYLESPYFIQLTAISTSYNFGVSAGAQASIPEKKLENLGIIPGYVGQLGGEYNEYPTFTYLPLQGEKYVEYLIKSIGLERFLLLKRTGWNLESLMDLMVDTCGNLRNNPFATDGSYEKFKALSQSLADISMRGDMVIMFMSPEHKGKLLSSDIAPHEVNAESIIKADQAGYYFKKNTNPDMYDLRRQPKPSFYGMQIRYKDADEADRVEALLDSKAKRTHLEDGRIVCTYALSTSLDLNRPKVQSQNIPVVYMGFRSFIDMMYSLSINVDVPQKDLTAGNARSIPKSALSDQPLIRVQTSDSRPDDAYVAVKYRKHWFYIDDQDTRSKEMFGFVNILFSLQSGNYQTMQPLITIPAR